MQVVPNDQVRPPTYQDVTFASVTMDNGEKMDLKLNIYLPPNVKGPVPALVYIFGGAWFKGDYTQQNSKTITWQLPLSLVKQGIAFVSIDYRRSQEAIFPAQIHDVKGAIRFLRVHGGEYGLDAKRVGVWGVSAGGHLAALAAATGDVQELEGDVGGNLEASSRVDAAVVLFPATDIFRMAEDMQAYVLPSEEAFRMHDAYDAPEAKLFGFDKPGQGMGVLRKIYDQKQIDSPYWHKAKLVEMSNPITWITKECAPMLIMNGAVDPEAAWKQSVRLYQALARAGAPALYLSDSQMGHEVTSSEELLTTVLQFMKNQLCKA